METVLFKLQATKHSGTPTNSDGYYWVRVDTGNYQMIFVFARVWLIRATVQLSIPKSNKTIVSFAHNAIAYCPLLNVELSTPFLRRCFNSMYYVNYCNTGTQAANNAIIHIDFDSDPALDTNNISVNWTLLSGNTYRFDIGTVNIGGMWHFPFNSNGFDAQ